MPPIRPLLPLLLSLVLAAPAGAGVRLTTAVNGAMVEVGWPREAFPIRYTADQRLVSLLPDGPAMLERAFRAWAEVETSRVSFAAQGVGGDLKPGKDGQNVVTIGDDLFTNFRAIAVTTNWDVAGTLVESDIQVDPTMIRGAYNIEQAITHEIGHLLGLDHSGVISAVMYPFVSNGNGEVVIDSDDRVAIASVYPNGDPTLIGGVLRGRVTGDNGGVFAAQVVAMNERGEAVATGLTNTAGEFLLEAIPDGKYRLYVEPLDGPVDLRNLSPYWRQASSKSFPTRFHSGEAVEVVNGRIIGNLVLSVAGAVYLNPRWLAVAAPGSNDFKLGSTAAVIRPGQTISIAVAGDGMTPAMTRFEVESPGIRRVSDFRYAANYIHADFEIAPNTPAGSVVILVTRGNETAALTGALRIQTSASGRRRVARR